MAFVFIPRDSTYIQERSIPEPNTGCWLWTNSACAAGYGKTTFRGKVSSASRVSYIIHKGEVPAGFEVDHLCYTPSCVNPDHLRAVTRLENIRCARRPRPLDRYLAHRQYGVSCRRGHLNIARNRQGLCVECAVGLNRQNKARRRARLACEASSAESARSVSKMEA